jgi:hypothetical protein
MRAIVGNDKSKLIIDLTKSVGRGIALQVLTGGINVFFAFGWEGAQELESNNANGISDGFMLNNLMNGGAPIIFEHFADRLYAIVPPGAAVASVFAQDFQARMPQPRTITQRTGFAQRAAAAASRVLK